MGHLYQRGAVWWIKYYVNGRAVREGEGNGGQEHLEGSRGRVANGQPILPRADRIRYDEIAKDLRTHYRTTGERDLEEAEYRLAHLDAFFGGWRVVNIGPAPITKYVEQRQGAGAANGTINRELATLSRMLRVGYENSKVHRLPVIRTLKEADPRQGFFEEAQYLAVRRHLPPDLQAATLVAYTFGWRVQSEVLTLERRQLDLATGTLRLDLGSTKNDDGSVVYLTPEVEIALTEQLARLDAFQRRTGIITPYLFPHLRGRRQGQPRHEFRKTWATACRQAGCPGMLLHDLRRTAVRNMERACVPRSVAMKLTGHKTENVYRRYAIVSDADLKAAARTLTGTFSGTPTPSVLESRLLSSR
jgi:integrase